MLVYLEAAGLLTDRVAPAWHLSPPSARRQPDKARRRRLGASLKAVLRRAGAALHRAHQRRRLIRELSRRSDHLLADIGITRVQIPSFAAAAVAGVDRRKEPTRVTPHQLRSAAIEAPANDNLAEIAA